MRSGVTYRCTAMWQCLLLKCTLYCMDYVPTEATKGLHGSAFPLEYHRYRKKRRHQARRKHFKGGQAMSKQYYLVSHLHRPGSTLAIGKHGKT